VNAIIYARYSSSKQDSGFSIEAQLNACRDYCLKNELVIVKEYIDEAFSGRSSDRPQFNQMLEDAKTGLFSKIIVHKFDRFSRDRTSSVLTKSNLKKYNVDVVSVSEPIDNSNAYGVVMESLYESLSHAYSQNLARESLKGMIEAVKAGYHVSGKPPYGYDLKPVMYKGKKRSKLVENKAESKIIKIIFQKYLDNNMGFKNIALYLNDQGFKTRSNKLFTPQLINKIAKNETITGTLSYNKDKKFGFDHVYIKDNHIKIIDKKDFNKVQKIMNERSTKKLKINSQYLLSGIIKCGCGSPMTGHTGTSKNGAKHHYYCCLRKIKTKTCDQVNYRRDFIDEKVLKAFQKEILNKSIIRGMVESAVTGISNKKNDLETQINTYKKQLSQTKNKYNKLMNILESSNDISYEDLAPRIKEHKKNIDELQLKIANQQIQIKKTSTIKLNTKEIENQVIDIIENIKYSKKIIKDHISSVIIDKKEITVNWVLVSALTGSPLVFIEEHLGGSFQLKIA
tara:strand:+ start:92 stop:1621 length:1530 start_codon:yes stop_codon:yes gene_type:complete